MGERWERGEQWGNTNRGYGQAIIWLLLIVGGVSCAEAPGDVDIPNALNPAGPAAGEIATLWWVMFGLGTFVFVLVLGIMLYTVLAGRRQDEDAVEEALVDEETGRRWLWLGGVALPAVILPIVLFFNLRTLAAVDQPPQPAVVNIEVVGHRWWWEVRYPDEGFTTANEIHVPVGQPVNIQLTSRDVIHSFWVPELHGKRDLNPGDTNTFWLQADEPGEYRGLCAEFCGEQHARMQFIVVASTPEQYQSWVQQQRQPAPEPTDEVTRRGQQVFLGSACVYCHTVRGTNATGDLGPDLTHLGSRRTLAAGTVANNRGNLAGWILDPQHIKPGNLMPPTNLPASDFQPLLEYLETLE
jgi:cytochrome c oxidase subunit 2